MFPPVKMQNALFVLPKLQSNFNISFDKFQHILYICKEFLLFAGPAAAKKTRVDRACRALPAAKKRGFWALHLWTLNRERA